VPISLAIISFRADGSAVKDLLSPSDDVSETEIVFAFLSRRIQGGIFFAAAKAPTEDLISYASQNQRPREEHT
jgi:hypothetical protein